MGVESPSEWSLFNIQRIKGGTPLKRLLFFVLLFTLGFCLFANADFGDTLLKQGMTHRDVNTLQKNLNLLGYFNDHKFTNYYGTVTEEAVIKFQKDYNLKADGIAGKDTLKYIITKINQIKLVKEKEQKEREFAASLQQNLKTLGHYTGDVTSKIDDATIEALKKFQEKEGIEITGTADQDTIARLDELFPKKVEEKKNYVSSRAFVDFTRKYLGTPYAYGASSGKAFDCSGFTTYVMKNYGIKLERTSSQQFQKGIPVEKKNLIPGDLVFFSTRGRTIGHVGIFIGDHKFIHASSSNKKVITSDLRTYQDKYMGARRYLKIKDEDDKEGEKKE